MPRRHACNGGGDNPFEKSDQPSTGILVGGHTADARLLRIEHFHMDETRLLFLLQSEHELATTNSQT